jgi:hypothetical protein
MRGKDFSIFKGGNLGLLCKLLPLLSLAKISVSNKNIININIYNISSNLAPELLKFFLNWNIYKHQINGGYLCEKHCLSSCHWSW